MILMIDNNEDLREIESRGETNGYKCEQLITPLTGFRNIHPDQRFAIDNGAFSKNGFNKNRFEAILQREKDRKHLCRFVAIPDVVGSARRTLEVFDYWFPRLTAWKLAFVCQDGQENLPIPWDVIDAVFIGGSTEWKESDHAKHIVRAAKILGKWVHVGRVNGKDRFTAFEDWGADSCDGSGIAQYTYMREQMTGEPPLFSRKELAINV